MEKEFNEHAINNNLNVNMTLEIIKYEKPTDSYSYFKTLVETFLKKSNSPFDIYIYESIYTNIYGSYLLNLNDYLPKEHIEMYNSKLVKEEFIYGKDELVGLPMGVSYEVLYSNKRLLNKYDKSIPKTWDELIDTCHYIMKKENDTELICYNGLFDDSEQGLYSLYEFIYSCRDSYNSSYPNPEDESFTNSLNMMQKLKNEIASDSIFRSNENFTFAKLMNDKAIFIKYWLVGEPLLSRLPYYLSILPGLKEGISGSMVLGYNMGIVKNLNEVKRNAALEVVKYFTSKKYQKNMFKNGLCTTALTEVLKDEDVCVNAPCDVVNKVQFIGIPKFIKDESENYKDSYKKYIYQFLYENKSIKETLKQIADITKIYYITLNTENSYTGFICFVIISVISLLMVLSLLFLLNEVFLPFFKILPIDFWIIIILGSVMILVAPFISYGSIKTINCYLRPLILSLGYTFNICPILYKLISRYPKQNKTVTWVSNHKYMFLLSNCLIDGLLCIIALTNLDPFNPTLFLVEDGENFKMCKYKGDYTIVFIILYKFIVIFFMLFFIFVERNISTMMHDMRFTAVALYIDTLCIFLILFFHFVIIENYKSYFIIQTIITSVISITNYISLFGFRIIFGLIRKQDLKAQFINNVYDNFAINETQMKTNNYNTFENNNI